MLLLFKRVIYSLKTVMKEPVNLQKRLSGPGYEEDL